MTERDEMGVAVLVGSLREGSYNRALYRAALELAPANMRLQELTIGGLPYYVPEIDQDGITPIEAERFRDGLRAADAMLIITPEYNHSLPGVLKNALDWASRPYSDAPIHGKPAAVMGASGSAMGTARAQLHLRGISGALRIHLLPTPSVLVGNAAEKFDAAGTLADEPTRQNVAELLAALFDWTRRLARQD